MKFLTTADPGGFHPSLLTQSKIIRHFSHSPKSSHNQPANLLKNFLNVFCWTSSFNQQLLQWHGCEDGWSLWRYCHYLAVNHSYLDKFPWHVRGFLPGRTHWPTFTAADIYCRWGVSIGFLSGFLGKNDQLHKPCLVLHHQRNSFYYLSYFARLFLSYQQWPFSRS